ncbi:hypothetical protein COW36_08210 [bacterium (Candidatus Blackallbacteria) CG17_big_fil_post_rev_8_21_14_2_50_48_46]|uniref:histidine kinase n=1 Tax=bacterium (Candidatus Blackallbacteria) CG17_big_fil_post_rev_8_21_14_2_50_48_46 TaxID=2014261 RepID=A0A2M7G6E2_9BACT|nr:MAG: hypothetical protein COW64_24750 [bacterium (Candidatus Blackallbacteria) CG18_big_fil_WC_8_21_14_2_50_49_26]PIW17473.1 MAG: hypothetical protein COW36_08210 [bacterium (Candidatus Blackallbacteria) CG17_big_fil_post_rev_8_21_14_2_50_48_46]PIW48327.1 MAG: hypothetical protein COW20_09565 [bacterium (Candidatus Blackallbacteria) CG13_big_fil_rev_8_21_14_2_50_49_14]
MADVEIEKHLLAVPFLNHLNHAQLQDLTKAGTLLSVEGGSVIFQEDDPADRLFIILGGSVRVEGRAYNGADIELSTLEAGDFFGEQALTEGGVRTATVTALKPSEFFILSRKDFVQILTESPALLSDVIAGISRKLESANANTLRKVLETHQMELNLERQHHRAVARMVTGMSQEILRPLEMIQSMSMVLSQDLLKEYLDSPVAEGQTFRQMMDATHLIQSQMERLQDLFKIFQYLDMEPMQEPPQTSIFVNTVKDIVDLYRLENHSDLDIQFEVNPAAEHKPWDGYPQLLSEVLNRVLENIEQHAYPEGIPKAVLAIKPTLLNNRAAYEIVLKDQGVGISEENLKRIREPFFTTARERGNIGLGLAIVDTLVTFTLQGSLEINASEETGTEVRIVLPRLTRAGKPV